MFTVITTALSAVPFKKEIILFLLAVAGIFGFSSYMYSRGYTSAMTGVEMQEQRRKAVELEAQLEAEKLNVKTVTEYVTEIQYIEKKVPVYVKQVKEIFAYDDSIIIPPALSVLHNAVVSNSDASATGTTDGSTQRPVTLGAFAERVIENYSICKANSVQLSTLQQWIVNQQKIYNKK